MELSIIEVSVVWKWNAQMCPKLFYQHIELVMNVHPELQWYCASQQWYFIYFALLVYHILCVIAVAFRAGSNRIIVSCYCNRFLFLVLGSFGLHYIV